MKTIINISIRLLVERSVRRVSPEYRGFVKIFKYRFLSAVYEIFRSDCKQRISRGLQHADIHGHMPASSRS